MARGKLRFVQETEYRGCAISSKIACSTPTRGNCAGVVPITPQVFDLLEYLILNRERVVSKDDLIDAIWKGRIVSDTAVTTRLNAVRTAIGDRGEEQRLIKTLPRKGFRFVGEVREALAPGRTPDAKTSVEPSRPALTLPDKPSIAVLPFANLSGDADQEYFADGMVEEIITGLSRFRWLFVIARNSSFTYKGKAVDVRRVGRELGVRYLLEGSVQKSANRIRIAGQLIDASSGTHLWADRLEGAIENVFVLQDQVTASVVGAIAPRLEQAEIERAKRKPPESLDAYDLLLRGFANVYKWTREGNEEALRLFYRAVERDPDFSAAYAAAAGCLSRRKGFCWGIDEEQEAAEARRLARRAVQSGKDDAAVLANAGHALAYVALDLDDGAAFLDQALIINPNLAFGWFAGGWIKVWLGEPDQAVERFAHAMRLNPIDPGIFGMQQGTAHAHFYAGRHDEALTWARMSLRELPDNHATLRIAAASSALAGHDEEAKRLMARLLEIDPALRVSTLKKITGPCRRPEYPAMYADALRKAGLPE
jgi:TolB-like protein/Tfp pilus assembly protein PilF